MITVEQAWAHLEQCAEILPSRCVALGEALGLRLQEPIVSGVDSPPFDKSLLDGYAVVAGETATTLQLLEQVIAGDVPHHAVVPGATISVMTGAPVPDGADAIVKCEDAKVLDDGRIQISKSGVKSGTGILQQGAAFHQGQEVLSAGRVLSPIDIALLAEVGRAEVNVTPRPQVAVLPTGNELVEAGTPVGVGQICNSNGPMLSALLEAVGAESVDLGIGRDDPAQLREMMLQGLEADVLLVSGGVSAGVMDLVPGVLADLGVREVFHKVRMKPGKPIWFGVYEAEGRKTLVFGMPGNPVSTLVSFEIFVKPVLRLLAGEEFAPARAQRAVLSDSVKHHGKRPTYYPSQIRHGERSGGLPTVEPLPWRGSADLAALTRANALTILPGGDYELAAGEAVEVLALL